MVILNSKTLTFVLIADKSEKCIKHVQKISFMAVFFLKIHTFILQGCIKLIRSDSKDFEIVTKDFQNFLFIKESKQKFHKNKKQFNCFQLS